MRAWLSAWVEREQLLLVQIQHRCHHPWLDPFFAYSTHLGTHTFFMLALPALFWFGYASVGRGMVVVLAMGVYTSGFVKDLFCLPRPKAPPILRITFSNSSSHLEYGFPSTHTTNAVSVALFLLTYILLIPDFWLRWTCITAVIFYAFSISFGRIYCGMHGLVDVVAGAILGCLIWWWWYAYWSTMEAFILSGTQVVPLFILLTGWLLITVHPDPVDSCPCFHDSVAFVSVLMGLLPSAWLMAFHTPDGNIPYDVSALPWSLTVLRLVFGVSCIVLFRLSAKPLLQRILPPIYRLVRAPYRKFYQPASTYGDYPKSRLTRVPSALHVIPSTLHLVGGLNATPAMMKHRRISKPGEEPETSSGVEDFVYEERNHLKRYDVDILTRVLVYTGIGALAGWGIPVWCEHIGLGG